MNCRESSRILSFLLITSFGLSSVLFGCRSSPYGQEKSDATDPYDDALKIATETIAPSGGKISVRNPDSSLDGLTIEVPAGAYETSVEFSIYEGPIPDIALEEEIDIISPMIIIDNGGEYSNEIMGVTVPIEVPEEDFAMAFLYDPENDKLEGVPTYPENNGSLTFLTRHFSTYAMLSVKKSTLDNLNFFTKYSPTNDFWNLPNAGSVVAPGGYCHGMALTSLYYSDPDAFGFDFTKQEPLYKDEYDNGSDHIVESPFFWQDDKRPIQLCSVANSLRPTERGAATIDKWWMFAKEKFALDIDEKHFYLCAFSLWASTDPHLLSIWNTQTNSGHALICYGIHNQSLDVLDPNIPLQASKIDYDRVSSSFEPYETANNYQDYAEGNLVTYDIVAFSGWTIHYNLDKLAELCHEYENKSLDKYFPSYDIVASNLDENENVICNYVLDTEGDVTEAGMMSFELDAPFDGRLRVYNDSLDELPAECVQLHPGDNYLGFLAEAKDDDYWWWVGFDWVSITCNYDETLQEREKDGACTMESLRRDCRKGVSGIKCPDGTCWRCVNGEPVQVECSDTNQ